MELTNDMYIHSRYFLSLRALHGHLRDKKTKTKTKKKLFTHSGLDSSSAVCGD